MSDRTPRELLLEYFGYHEFRPGQQRVIDTLLAGRSSVAVFPTGGGKSLCYQLPALALDGLTLVVSPLIALMKDQIDFLATRGIPAVRLDSSLTLDETRAIGDRLAAGTLKMLYVAPERFNNERFLAQISRVKIALFAIDEAHCISAWGHNFRPDYLKLADIAREIGAERVLALTATATPQVVDDIRETFDIAVEDAIVTGFYRPNLKLATTPIAADRRDGLLVSRIRSRAPGPTIVYVTFQKTAERIAALLTSAGIPAEAYHAGMEPEERARVQETWMASDQGVVVATIAFGMGIDKSDVRYVYHYNLPKSLESYSQEIGRAGRDGEWSTVELLATPDDVPMLENFVYGDTPTIGSLQGLCRELLSKDREFDVSLYDLSSRHDLRQLVLRTTLTYIELAGILKQGTPFYAGYEFKFPRGRTMAGTLAAFAGESGAFMTAVLRFATERQIWYSINPDLAAESLGVGRYDVVRALETLQERGMAELRVSDSRQRYTLLSSDRSADSLATELYERFIAREEAEVSRIGQVLDLVAHDGCQTNLLVAYFGEARSAGCGHCSYCRTGRALTLPEARPMPPLAGDLHDQMAALRRQNAVALGEPRKAARFLCGLTSPSLTKARLSRHPLFASLEERRFSEVLSWLS